MSKHEFPPFNMIIENGRLVPATPYDAERLDSFRRGTKVKVRFTEEKDRVLVRKWFAIIGLVVKQCNTPWKTKEEASEAVKLALGIVNLTKTVKNDFLAYPKSLTELEDPELQEAVDQMTELLSRLTGVDVETLKKETAHVVPEPDEAYDPDTGEIIEHEASDASTPSASDDGSAPPPALSEPAGELPVSAPAGSSSEPDMFGKFNFGPGEIVHLKDFARKAIKEAIAHDSVALCTANIDRMKLNYREVIESKEGTAAMEAMDTALAALMAGRRNQSQVENYIARDVIGCKPEELEGRK